MYTVASEIFYFANIDTKKAVNILNIVLAIKLWPTEYEEKNIHLFE